MRGSNIMLLLGMVFSPGEKKGKFLIWEVRKGKLGKLYLTLKSPMEFVLWPSRLRIQLASMRMRIRSLALWVKDLVLLWAVAQVTDAAWIGIAVAVAQACNCSSNATPSLGTSICCRCGPKQTNKQKTSKGNLMVVLDKKLIPFL